MKRPGPLSPLLENEPANLLFSATETFLSGYDDISIDTH
jgi:hypothetical protein